ncbi:5839_t:CDS:2, partial [Gigaspora margarita]
SLEEARLNDGKNNLYWVVLNDGTVEEFEQSLESLELSERAYKKKDQKIEKEMSLLIYLIIVQFLMIQISDLVSYFAI